MLFLPTSAREESSSGGWSVCETSAQQSAAVFFPGWRFSVCQSRFAGTRRNRGRRPLPVTIGMAYKNILALPHGKYRINDLHAVVVRAHGSEPEVAFARVKRRQGTRGVLSGIAVDELCNGFPAGNIIGETVRKGVPAPRRIRESRLPSGRSTEYIVRVAPQGLNTVAVQATAVNETVNVSCRCCRRRPARPATTLSTVCMAVVMGRDGESLLSAPPLSADVPVIFPYRAVRVARGDRHVNGVSAHHRGVLVCLTTGIPTARSRSWSRAATGACRRQWRSLSPGGCRCRFFPTPFSACRPRLCRRMPRRQRPMRRKPPAVRVRPGGMPVMPYR